MTHTKKTTMIKPKPLGRRMRRKQEHQQKKAEKKAEKKAAAAMTFRCMICDEDKHITRKMPRSSLGCNCAGVICVACFLTDFDHRASNIFVSENETGGLNLSKWEDDDALVDHVLGMFQRDVEYEQEDLPVAFTAYALERIKTGKRCPFCAKLCIWRQDRLPHISATTGKLTFRAPDHVLPGNFPLGPGQ